MSNHFEDTVEKMAGPIVPVLPAFGDDGSLDLESTCGWIEWLIENGMKSFWTTGGTTHYFCLTDDEIYTLTKAIAQTIGDRAVFIASINWHWPVHKARDFIEFAHGCGVDVVKVMLDCRYNPSDEGIVKCYRDIAKDSPLPLLAYTLAPNKLSYDVFRQVMAIPQYVGMKNDADDYYMNCQYLKEAREFGREDFLVITGGTMSAFLHGHNFGQKYYADVVAMYSPSKSLECYEHIMSGDIEAATQIIKEYEEPIMRAGLARPMGHWTLYHTILKVKGLFASNNVRYPQRRIVGDLKAQMSECVPKRDLEKVK